MYCKISLVFVSFAALDALERPLSCVQFDVTLQMTRRGASEVALVTFVGLFSCVVPHHVSFHLICSNTGKLSHL